MDAAEGFIAHVESHPVADSGEELVDIVAAANAAQVPLRCATTPHLGGGRRIHYLRAGLIHPLLRVAEAMHERAWLLRIEDAYRTPLMQRRLAHSPTVLRQVALRVGWAERDAPAEQIARRLAVLVAATPKVAGHMAGAAVDVSVLDHSDREVDRGGTYLEMSHRTPMNSPYVSAAQRANREEISSIMTEYGFYAYPYEFWHYSAGDAFAHTAAGDLAPAGYGPVCMSPDGAVESISDALTPLNSVEETVRLARTLLASAGNDARA